MRCPTNTAVVLCKDVYRDIVITVKDMLPMVTDPEKVVSDLVIDMVLSSDERSNSSTLLAAFIENMPITHQSAAREITSALDRALWDYYDALFHVEERVKYFGEPYARAVSEGNFITFVVTAMAPKTDYNAALVKLVDGARERGEFIPYRILEFIGQG